jgi:hypothetical protein
MTTQTTDLEELKRVAREALRFPAKPGVPLFEEYITPEHVIDLLDRLSKAEKEIDDLARKVFVPGVRRCAKCSLRLVTTTLHVADGSMSANNAPQDCPNGCGPLWPVTEREAGNELCERLDAAELRASKAEEREKRLAAALGGLAELVLCPQPQPLPAPPTTKGEG